MAPVLSLAPIADVVCFDHPERPAHADQRTDPHQPVVEPERRLETPVNQPTMETDGMTDQQGDSGQPQEDRYAGPAEREEAGGDCPRKYRAVPQRVERVPDDPSGFRVGFRAGLQVVDSVGIIVVAIGSGHPPPRQLVA